MTKEIIENAIDTPEYQLTLKELTSLLIKNYGIKNGYYETSVRFGITVGGVNGPDNAPIPGVSIGVAAVGLIPSIKENPNAVNAADTLNNSI